MAPASPDYSELSSISATIEAVTRRVSGIAERADRGGEESVAAELFAVERALDGAQRRLSRMLKRGS